MDRNPHYIFYKTEDKIMLELFKKCNTSWDSDFTIYDEIREEYVTGKERGHYVVWSGGCDSTLILYNLCSLLDHPSVITCKPSWLGDEKIMMEKIARSNIKKFIESTHQRQVSIYESHSIELNVKTHTKAVNYGIVQPEMWLLQTLPFIPNHSVVHFGYIQGDCFWYYKEKFLNIAKNTIMMLGKSDISISFPLRHTPKYEILSELMDIKDDDSNSLYDQCWWCELPMAVGKNPNEIIHTKCERCNACITHKIALDFLKHMKTNKL